MRRMRVAWIILVAFPVLSFGQTSTKKAPPAPAKSDTWQRSKDCASQAEKVMADKNASAVAMGYPGAMSWENHYSPRYERCFIKASYMTPVEKGGGKDSPAFSNTLTDAFERAILATSASVGPTDGFCHIDGKPADCAKAEAFIAEHMKN